MKLIAAAASNHARRGGAAKTQLVDSVCLDPVGASQPSKSKSEAKQEIPIYESPEERELFEKTLAAIWQIMGGLEEIPSKRLTDELNEFALCGGWASARGISYVLPNS